MFVVTVNMSTIFNTQVHEMYSIRHVAIRRSDDLRVKFTAETSMYDSAMFVWTDEGGCDWQNSAQKFGHSLRGIPPVDHEKRSVVQRK